LYSREKAKLRKLLGDGLYDLLKAYKCVLAGGAITSLFTRGEINDFDVYFRNKELLGEFLYDGMEGQFVLSKNDKAILFKYDGKIKVQLVYFSFFENPVDIFNTFDFTVCMGAYDFATEEFIFHENFFKHNSQRILVFNEKTAFPIISALRIDKYKSKGYYISKTEFIRAMLTVSKLNINSYDELISQIGGMYGERYDTWVDCPKDFDFQDVLNNLSQINADEYAEPCEQISDWDAFIQEVTGVKRVVFRFNANLYEASLGGVISRYYGEESKVNVKPIEDALRFPLHYYKYVKKRNDKLVSYYDNNFEYRLNETIKPKYDTNGIYCVPRNGISTCQYHNDPDSQLIRLRVDSINDFFNIEPHSNVVLLKRCVFDKIITEDIIRWED
jgi:hypothetical protein